MELKKIIVSMMSSGGMGKHTGVAGIGIETGGDGVNQVVVVVGGNDGGVLVVADVVDAGAVDAAAGAENDEMKTPFVFVV